MADGTNIEWTDATWNVLTGCSVLSPGCTNCYAMKLAASRLQHHPSRAGLTRETKGGPVWTGEVRFNNGEGGLPDWLRQPLRWSKARTIFVCAHSDLFHENVPDAVLHQVWAVMALVGHHTMQVLSKRSARMREFTRAIAADPAPVIDQVNRLKPSDLWNRSAFQARHNLEAGPLPNVWGGVSTEDQRRVEERVPDVLEASLAHRFISAEPLLGQIDFTNISTMRFRSGEFLNALTGDLEGMFGDHAGNIGRKLDWIITGGESGPDARFMDQAWPRAIRDQCEQHGTLFMHKQNGSRTADGRLVSKKITGRLLDGREHNDVPKKETVNV